MGAFGGGKAYRRVASGGWRVAAARAAGLMTLGGLYTMCATPRVENVLFGPTFCQLRR